MVCLSNVQFFAITNGTESSGKWTYANIFGLAPRETNKAPYYITAMKNAGAINSLKTTLFLNVNSTLKHYEDTYSIMSFGSDKRDFNEYAKGDWYPHEWDL